MNSFGPPTSAFSLEDYSTSTFSSSTTDSNNRDCSFFDLKLGRFGDLRDTKGFGICKGAAIASSSESSTPSTPPKRMRCKASPQTARCQVYGCNKDLISSKEYHKRHRVCEAHTKTAKVVVNGIEQRFCQQCSRFHLLVEFDDCKRSCRKRLAGHNERRRKPQVGIHSRRTGRILQSCNGLAGGQFHGNALTSFVCQDILPSGLLHPPKYGTNDWCRRIKVEDRSDFSSPLLIPATNGHLPSKPVLLSDKLDNAYPFFHENIPSTASGSIFSENTNHYPQQFGGQYSDPHSLVQSTSFGNGNITAFNAASTIQGFSGITDSGGALSLLSSQAQNSSNHSSGIPMAYPLTKQGSSLYHITGQVSEKLIGVSSQISAADLSNRLSLSTVSSMEGSPLDPILLSDSSVSMNLDVENRIYQGSHISNSKDHISCEDGNTMDLFQLSLQLDRVERERQSMNVKQENNAFCWPRIT